MSWFARRSIACRGRWVAWCVGLVWWLLCADDVGDTGGLAESLHRFAVIALV